MTDIQTKLTFRERLGLLAYGFKLAAKTTPSYFPLMLARALITAAQPLTVLFFSARILNELDGARDVRAIIIYVSATVGAAFFMSALSALLTREIQTVSDMWRLYQNIQMIQAEQFIKMDFAHAEDSAVSETLARMDVQARGNGLGLINVYLKSSYAADNLFSVLLAALLLFGPLSGDMRLTGWPAWALSGVFIAGILIGLNLQSRSQNILKAMYAENAKANTAADYYQNYVKAGQAAKDIRLYDQVPAVDAIFQSSFDVGTWLKFFFFTGRTQGFISGSLAVVGGGFYLIAGHGALSGTVSVGSIVQSVGAVTTCAMSVGTLAIVLGQMFDNAGYLKPMREYLSLPAPLRGGGGGVPANGGESANRPLSIEFRNVSFRYPGAETYALKDLSLTLTAGRRLAVVGLNGSGKTTMIKLLCRLYEPTEGKILLGGVDIREYDHARYTALFSVVFQDFHLFPLQLGANVAAAETYDKDRAAACLGDAGFTGRLDTMPDGLDTILYKSFDENGTQVSGGEAQKIALARALYKDAPFVILDEPTAALDPIAEYEVYSTLEQTIGDKTAVFISHRLSSCRFCHDIAVFDGGHMVQRGGHDTLLADENGLYRRLWDAQAQHYAD